MNLAAQSLRLKIIFGLWLIWQIVIAFSCRPVQDDYSYLDIGSNAGFSNYLSDFWKNWGGNLFPSLIRIPFYLLYLPSISGSQWWGLALYSFLTSMLVLFATLILTTWLRGKTLSDFDSRDLLLAIFTCIGFEGIFSPGVLAAFVFGPASSTHLLPVCILIIGLWLCTLNKMKLGLFPALFILGFIAGNCNFAEGGLAVVTISLLLICYRLKNKIISGLGFINIQELIIFGMGTYLGFITIVASPGFENRANSGNGLPSGFNEILIGFRSSFVSFSGDVITHPVWIFLAIFAILFLKKGLKEEIVQSRALALILLTVLCYLSLIIGTAFAYAAWHQSVGLLFLLTPSSIAIAYLFLRFERIVSRFSVVLKISLGVLALLIPLMITRVTVLEVQRGLMWDRNLLANSCLISADNQAKLLGAEIKYPPLGLGIEDVNRWEWMSNNYKNWLASPSFKSGVICD
jgi:hypothetical protein